MNNEAMAAKDHRAQLSDRSGRRLDYVRISVTDRCDLRCRYCTPAAGAPHQPKDAILRYEEIARLVRVFSSLGVSRVRLTGGEPLVRPHLDRLIELTRREAPSLEDLALTTNGQRLARLAPALRRAGLDRVNVSLDSLRPDRYRAITGGELAPVIAGIDRAEREGLTPVKVNVVLVRGLNDDEVLDFVRLTLERPLSVRFIELMPLGEQSQWRAEQVVRGEVLQGMLEASFGDLELVDDLRSSRGGAVHRLPGAVGTVSLISPLSAPFCGACNRLRLTADGKLRLCLLAEQAEDLRGPLRRGASDEEMAEIIAAAAWNKPRAHALGVEERCHPTTPMCSIGG